MNPVDDKLALFVCNDQSYNLLVEFESGMPQPPQRWEEDHSPSEEMASGNYGSTWTDINRDGYLDLYLAKCHPAATQATDPRRVNQLWMGGSQGFTERAADFNLDIGRQSWASDFADLDNDGDLDMVLANHGSNSQIFIQESPGQFTDRSFEWGMTSVFNVIQIALRDFDNDGYVDLLLSGSKKEYYKNVKGKRFELLDGVLGFHSF